MSCIYIEASHVDKCRRTTQCPTESAIVIFISNHCHPEIVTIKAVHPAHAPQESNITLTSRTDVDLISYEHVPDVVKKCKLPCFVDSTCPLVLTGLSTVLRKIVKLSGHLYKPNVSILGHKDICLKACAEVSSWTKFCEVDLPCSVDKCLSQDSSELPHNLIRLENHLSQPVAVPNANKWKEKLKSGDGSTTLKRYAEGYSLTLTDLVLLPCISLIFDHLKITKNYLSSHLPLVLTWYTTVCSQPSVQSTLVYSGLPRFLKTSVGDIHLSNSCMNSTTFDSSTFSIREPEKKKIKATVSQLISAVTGIDETDLIDAEESHPCLDDGSLQLLWKHLPKAVNPMEGDLPQKRVERKCQQMENLASAVRMLARPGDVIVDFCSGGGHLGILVAYLLPDCKVIMVENKEESNDRALRRIKELNLSNICIYQGNLDYFVGAFDIGMCLHACGVATDLVMKRCIDNKASFVVCPCCYGFIRNTHTVQYPQSHKWNSVNYEKYLLLCHAADQPHTHATCNGKRYMMMVDSDRAHAAREHGYHVILCSLHPLTCSPKNNLLIGKSPRLTRNT